MKQLFRITIHWKHSTPNLELRHLEGHVAKNTFKHLDHSMGNLDVMNLYANNIDYLIDAGEISYVEYKKDIIVEEGE